VKVWDAIIVGAGPAGCACAYDLASAGKSVLLLDKAEFPRKKACAGGLTSKTVHALRYSIEPVVRQVVRSIVLETRDSSRIPVHGSRTICVMTVREELDAFCLKKTIEAGAGFQRISRIEAIDEGTDEVTITMQDAVMRGRFLVGADGANSEVRRLTGDESWFRKAFAIEANVRRSGEKEDLVFDFAPVASGYGWVFPKRDHVNVGLYSLSSDEKLNRDRLSFYIASRYGSSALTEDFIGQYAGFGAAQHHIERNRVFLVGDAGGFVDLLTGEGICGAVLSGQAAAAAITSDLEKKTTAKETFIRLTENLRKNLHIAEHIAGSFYANPQRGFQAMKMPFLRSAILKSYTEGFDLSALTGFVGRFLPSTSGSQ
jgi:geranylgeranyl reductase family protein